jgi:hypothetical protein
MGKQQQGRVNLKTCPACDGTWPSDRRNRLACGASLESVPALPASEGRTQEPLEWARLDTMTEEGVASGMPQPTYDEQKPGCLGGILPA